MATTAELFNVHDAPRDVPARAEPSGDAFALMVERLASNPAVDVSKLERILEMQTKIQAHNAKAEFDAAFSEMQGEIPTITEKGEIVVDGRLRSKYATNEDIQETVRPILQKYGFAIRFRNEALDNGKLKIVGILSHRSGHSEHDEFVTAPDTSGKKADIQAIGSARSYGQRYTTLALLNIATRGADDDGEGTRTKLQEQKAPDGYQAWKDDMTAVADEGWPAFQQAWAASKDINRVYSAKHDMAWGKAMKAKAQAVKPS